MLEIIKSLLIAFFAVAVLLPVIRYAFRRLSPVRTLETMTADEVKFIQKRELILTIAYFFFASVFAVFSAGMLALLASILHASKEHLHVLTPNFRAFFAPGLLIGLTLALLPLRLVQKTLMGHDYELYKTYLAQNEGHQSKRMYGVLLLLMLVLSGVVGWFALRWHVTIDAEQMEVTNLLNEHRTYQMQDIQSIHYLGAEGEYLVTFDDQTNVDMRYLKPVQLEMIAMLSQQSGKRVIR